MKERNGSGSPRPLPRAVRRLGWISFFTDVASEMAYPVVPLFLASVLGAPATVVGAVEGVAEAVVSLVKGLSGWLSDRMGRRTPWVRAGYGLGALSKPVLAAALAWPVVLLARSLDRLGKGLRTTARDAMIADAVDAPDAARAYGFHRMMDTAGALVGVLLALALLELLPGRYRLIFLLAALPGAAAVWLTFRLRESAPLVHEAGCAAPAALRARLSRGYWRTLAPLALFAFANSSDAFLILRAHDLGLGDTLAVLAYALFNLTYAAASYPAGVLADRFGRWRMLLGGWLLYAGVYVGFATATASGVWGLFALYGLYMGLTEGTGKAVVAVRSPAALRGTALGAFQMISGLAALSGSLAAGGLWDAVGPGAAFGLGAGAALAAFALALALRPWRDG